LDPSQNPTHNIRYTIYSN